MVLKHLSYEIKNKASILKSILFPKQLINFFLDKFRGRKRKIYEKNLFKIESVEDKFTKIYNDNYWQDKESRSGSGSSLSSTENIRNHLLKIFDKFKIKKVFDAPCGDFNWMYHVMKHQDIDYCGADIVEDLIILNKTEYENDRIKFKKLDIRTDTLPKSDLMICRDCLFHFSFDDINLFLKNFLSSDIKYILLTINPTEEENFKNKDIVTGDFRLTNFFLEPFNFKKNYIYSFDDKDVREIEISKKMYLFTKEQINENFKCIKLKIQF